MARTEEECQEENPYCVDDYIAATTGTPVIPARYAGRARCSSTPDNTFGSMGAATRVACGRPASAATLIRCQQTGMFPNLNDCRR